MQKRGFTLIELLVVISIIGVLSTIIAVGVRQAKTSAQDARRMADINALQRAIELSYLATPDYTAVLGSGCGTVGDRVVSCDGGLTEHISIDLISDVTTDTGCATMASGCDYSISVTPTTDSYRIGFWLAGGLANMTEGVHYLTEDGIQ